MNLNKIAVVLRVFTIAYIVSYMCINPSIITFGQEYIQKEKKKSLAILNLEGLNISYEDSIIITNSFRSELFSTRKFDLIDRSLVEKVLSKYKSTETGSCDIECAVEIGRELSCDKVITGNVSRLGKIYIINPQMIDIATRSLEIDTILKKECRIEDLPSVMPSLVTEFIQKYEEIGTKKEIADSTDIATQATRDGGFIPVKTRPKGTVIVRTIPDEAIISLDGKLFGISPLESKKVDAGEHTFMATKNGYTDAKMTIDIPPRKTTEVILSLKPRVISSPVAEIPKEEENTGTLWYILGGIAVVGVVAAILLSGGDEEPMPTTGTLVVNNNLNFSLQVTINGSSHGTISAASSRSWELLPGSHTVKFTSSTETGILSKSSQNTGYSLIPDQTKRPGSVPKPGLRNTDRGNKRIGAVNNPDAYSRTYTIEIEAGKTTIINQGADWDNGDLYVTSNPSQASIWLNGIGTGRITPSKIDEVNPGSHTITCKKIGYNDGSKTVIVTAGRTENVHINLINQGGALYITSNPTGATIWLDGKNTNKTTPAQIDGVTTGQHTVTCKKSEYGDASRTVTVSSGETINVHLELTRQTGSINVTSSPSGANIFLDGVNAGKVTPSLLDSVPAGNHTVTCKHTGYFDRSQKVTITTGQTTSLNLILLPITTGMVSIPSGCFDMGDNFNEGNQDELPVHRVCVSGFQMNKYEITVAAYKHCVENGACEEIDDPVHFMPPDYYTNPKYDDYPIHLVTWHQARSYCQWIGGRLPTEAEWEYAARGGLAGKRFPWGDDDDTSKANYNYRMQGTTKVGSYPPNGYGLYDMAGNVWELVNDWYLENYYSISPAQDPQGPSSGLDRVMRGGDYECNWPEIRVAERVVYPPNYSDFHGYVGFRCVK